MVTRQQSLVAGVEARWGAWAGRTPCGTVGHHDPEASAAPHCVAASMWNGSRRQNQVVPNRPQSKVAHSCHSVMAMELLITQGLNRYGESCTRVDDGTSISG